MRTIKFRAKTLDNMFWVYGDLSTGRCQYITYFDEEHRHFRIPMVISETIGQFTGLFDKNGKEIYEGDIVNGGCYNGSYRLGKMSWHKNMFIALPLGKLAEGYSDDFEQFEVIGNIHDNPELLK